ncbi:GNAT family N-acetyltransferase, partial [Rhodococcus sp. PAE-6]|nr:GNAT family N-acetyltransferase [Rhodococcus sp. PAE-6]
MLIRRERPADVRATADVHRAAFAPFTPEAREPVEPGLVASLRASDAWQPP